MNNSDKHRGRSAAIPPEERSEEFCREFFIVMQKRRKAMEAVEDAQAEVDKINDEVLERFGSSYHRVQKI